MQPSEYTSDTPQQMADNRQYWQVWSSKWKLSSLGAAYKSCAPIVAKDNSITSSRQPGGDWQHTDNADSLTATLVDSESRIAGRPVITSSPS
jgi:hypothetical protein